MNESWSRSWSWICPSWTKSRPTCISTARTAPLRNPATPESELVVCSPSSGRRVGRKRKRKRNRGVSSFRFRHQLLPRPRRPPSRPVLFPGRRHRCRSSPTPPPYALVLGGSFHLPGQYMDRSSLFQLIQEQVRKRASERARRAAAEVSMVTGAPPGHHAVYPGIETWRLRHRCEPLIAPRLLFGFFILPWMPSESERRRQRCCRHGAMWA